MHEACILPVAGLVQLWVCCLVQVEAQGLQAVLEGELGWSFDISELGGESDDEDAPVVVEL